VPILAQVDTNLISSISDLIDRYGLPILTLLLLGALLWKGVLRLGSDVDRIIKQLDAQVVYVEERRKEERAGRVEAEARLASNSEALREATAGFKEANAIMQALMERAEARSG
jgi:hypothetical protein